MEDAVARIVATLLSRRQPKWNEDMAWRYAREYNPRLCDQALQQIIDRVQWEMGR